MDETKIKKYIREQIRSCIRAKEKDEGIPHHYNSDNHEYSRRLDVTEIITKRKKGGPMCYYVKSDRAIATAAQRIFERLSAECSDEDCCGNI